MAKIKWGVLGTASIARWATIPGMKQAENCELYAVAGRDIKKAEAYKEEFGFRKAYGSYDELLADKEVQAVYIPLPNHIHYEWCLKAIKAGKHVLCEKPLVPTKEMAKELFEAAKAQGVHLMEAFAYLHSPYVAAVREDVQSGKIGKVEYIESAFVIQQCEPENIRMFKDMYGGAFYDVGCYCLSMMEAVLGTEPIEARALAEYGETGIDLFTSAYLKFPGDVRAAIDCGMIFGRERNSRMDRLYIHGSKGYIKSEVEYNQAGDLEYTLCIYGVKETRRVHADHNYKLEVEQLGRCITDGETPYVSPDFSIKHAEAIDLVIKAMGY